MLNGRSTITNPGAMEAEPSALLGPACRQVAPEFLHSEVVRLTSIENRLDDVRRKKRTVEGALYITFIKSSLLGD